MYLYLLTGIQSMHAATLFKHFSSEGHNYFLNDVSIIFIDKTDPKDPNKLEHYWQHTSKTMTPQGLNVQDD